MRRGPWSSSTHHQCVYCRFRVSAIMLPSTIQCPVTYNKKKLTHTYYSPLQCFLSKCISNPYRFLSVVNNYLKLGWVNLVSNHRILIFLWQQCYMPSWNCHVNTPKIHHIDYLVSLEWKTHANSHSWSNLQIALHALRMDQHGLQKWCSWTCTMRTFLTRVSWKELIML